MITKEYLLKEITQIIIIKWIDATYNSSSWSRNDLKKEYGLLELVTVGQLVEERENCFLLASEYNIQDDNFRHIIAIPKACIKSVRIVKL